MSTISWEPLSVSIHVIGDQTKSPESSYSTGPPTVMCAWIFLSAVYDVLGVSEKLTSIWQDALHPSPLVRLPSSHCSSVFMFPFPQMGV